MTNYKTSLPFIANILLWALTAYIAYVFAGSCYNMLGGDSNAVEFLNEHGDTHLRYAVAILEGLGALMILWPRTVIMGASLLAISMIGVLSADMSPLGGIPAQPVLMLVLSLVLLVGRLGFSPTNLFKQSDQS